MKPTESELEIMQILWEHGPMTVRSVNERLNEQRTVGYTTTLKIMQIMVEKRLLTRDTSQRSHVFTPTLSPETVQSSVVDHILKTVFRGSSSSLVLQALGNHRVSGPELKEIKSLIEKMEDQSDDKR